MSTHQCARCDGMGIICQRCGQPHTAWNKSFRRCRSRKTVPCPGAPVKAKDGEVVRVGQAEIIPHFDTHTECDVCRVQKRGEFAAPAMAVGATRMGGIWSRNRAREASISISALRAPSATNRSAR